MRSRKCPDHGECERCERDGFECIDGYCSVPGHAERETVCNDRRDDDGDGMVDCSDADCFGNGLCQAGTVPEITQDACSDWIDNDGDGYIDCDDSDCKQADIPYCLGSADRIDQTADATSDQLPATAVPTGSKTNVEDFIGVGSDNDGERNDFMCSDGLDNDGDGRIDCADFGCRFDPQVTVCSRRNQISRSRSLVRSGWFSALTTLRIGPRRWFHTHSAPCARFDSLVWTIHSSC
ncbi:MAG: hypothetical protein R3A47_05005 [Polyangiales bacterium]